jgi:hypothetical protein
MADSGSCAICGAPSTTDVLRAIDAAEGNARQVSAALNLPYTTLLDWLRVYRLPSGETLQAYRARVYRRGARSPAYVARKKAGDVELVTWTGSVYREGRRLWEEHTLRLRVDGAQRAVRLYLPEGVTVEPAHRIALRAELSHGDDAVG